MNLNPMEQFAIKPIIPLHLAGYDHERPKDAKVMEPLEVKILKRLGVADPYVTHAP